MLTIHTRNISDKDKDFVRWYIKLGYITLLFWLISSATWVMNYLFALNILNVIYTISISILMVLLVISVVSILSDVSLVKWWTLVHKNYSVKGNRQGIVLKYLPIYNIYLRYDAHNFALPNWWIKESILLRTLFWIITMTGNIFLTSSLLILIILRVAALMSDIDFIPLALKQWLNTLFLKNPEELAGYLTGTIVYLVKSFARIWRNDSATLRLKDEIDKEKTAYSRITHVQKNPYIIGEYFLGILLVIWLAYIIPIDFTIRTYSIWFTLLVARYLTMFVQLKHLPHLPIAREIVLLVKTRWARFTK